MVWWKGLDYYKCSVNQSKETPTSARDAYTYMHRKIALFQIFFAVLSLVKPELAAQFCHEFIKSNQIKTKFAILFSYNNATT